MHAIPIFTAVLLDTNRLYTDPYLVLDAGTCACGLLSTVNSIFRDSDLPHMVAERSRTPVRQFGTRFLPIPTGQFNLFVFIPTSFKNIHF